MGDTVSSSEQGSTGLDGMDSVTGVTGEGDASGFDAIVLAGGRSRRMNGIDKAEAALAKERLVDRVVAAAREARSQRVIVVGTDSAGAQADVVVRESPPFSGPLAGLAAGLAQATAPWILLLSCDLEQPRLVCAALDVALRAAAPRAAAAAHAAAEGIVLADEDGRAQWLAAAYQTAALRRAFAAIEGPLENQPLKRALSQLQLTFVPASNQLVADIDTQEDLKRARDAHASRK